MIPDVACRMYDQWGWVYGLLARLCFVWAGSVLYRIPWNHNNHLNMSVWWKHAFIRNKVHQLHVVYYEFIITLIDLQS